MTVAATIHSPSLRRQTNTSLRCADACTLCVARLRVTAIACPTTDSNGKRERHSRLSRLMIILAIAVPCELPLFSPSLRAHWPPSRGRSSVFSAAHMPGARRPRRSPGRNTDIRLCFCGMPRAGRFMDRYAYHPAERKLTRQPIWNRSTIRSTVLLLPKTSARSSIWNHPKALAISISRTMGRALRFLITPIST